MKVQKIMSGKVFKTQCQNLVNNYVIPAGVKDKRVISAMLTVPRHLFVPKEYQTDAYLDIALPIENNQTISQPSLVGIMTQALDLKGNEKVLEIGTGSGYQAAILSKLAKRVYSVEIRKDLAKTATKKLSSLGYKNAKVINANGSKGLSNFAPYDSIIVTACVTKIPKALTSQLKESGRIIVPIGPNESNQTLKLGRKVKGKAIFIDLMPVAFVPLVRGNKT